MITMRQMQAAAKWDTGCAKPESEPPVRVQRLVSCPLCGGDAESDTMQGFRRMKDGKMSNAVAIYCTKCTAQMTMCHEDFRNTRRRTF